LNGRVIDFQRLFHSGLRVDDIEAAMDDLGAALGLTWCELQRRPQMVWTQEDGSREVDLQFVYSRGGPQHVELLEAPPGTPWHAGDQPGLHHLGVWVDDLPAEAARLIAGGWTVTLAQKPPGDGYGAFAYLQPPTGLLVELVDARLEPRFERWFAGGTLG